MPEIVNLGDWIEVDEAEGRRLAHLAGSAELAEPLAAANQGPPRPMADVVRELRQKLGTHGVLDAIVGHPKASADDQAEIDRLRELTSEVIGRPLADAKPEDRGLAAPTKQPSDAEAIKLYSKQIAKGRS